MRHIQRVCLTSQKDQWSKFKNKLIMREERKVEVSENGQESIISSSPVANALKI